MYSQSDVQYMRRCLQLARCGRGSTSPNPMVGAVVVCDGRIIGEGYHVRAGEPHAEVNAIRSACASVGTFSLKGYTIYSSCEPCPMCLGAIYWAGISRIVYGASAEDAAEVNFSDKFIYDELALAKNRRTLPIERTLEKEALVPFIRWRDKEDKIEY